MKRMDNWNRSILNYLLILLLMPQVYLMIDITWVLSWWIFKKNPLKIEQSVLAIFKIPRIRHLEFFYFYKSRITWFIHFLQIYIIFMESTVRTLWYHSHSVLKGKDPSAISAIYLERNVFRSKRTVSITVGVRSRLGELFSRHTRRGPIRRSWTYNRVSNSDRYEVK